MLSINGVLRMLAYGLSFFLIMIMGLAHAGGSGEIQMINFPKESLTGVKLNSGIVAIVTVKEVNPILEGTRSASVIIKANLNDVVYGNIEEGRSLARSGKVSITVGDKLIVVLADLKKYQPHYHLEEYQVIDCMDCSKIIEFSKKVIDES
ncbi:MAG: hypothetical protein KUG82_02870 [Pseudomonadales bacterium]|nr:hypothetical protein [Pseudomonadales bacterium]